MRPLTRLVGTLLLAALAAPLAQAESRRTQWKLSEVTWVKLVPAEPGAPVNAHPAAVADETLRTALGAVRAIVEDRAVPLFDPEELKPLAKALSEALAQAQVDEDLLLLSTHKRGGGFLDPAMGLTARLFLREGALNLIVHDARHPFMDHYLIDRTLPTFVFGSRTAAASTDLQAPGATRLRSDWLALPLTLTLPLPQAMVPGAAAPTTARPSSPLPSPAAQPPAPAAPTRDATFYEAQTQRLKALKKLREENLLSEAEYQEKRDAILKTL